MPRKMTATVRIKNNTSYNIISASVSHKYSDNYKNSFDFKESIHPNSLSQGKMTVEYNVGLFTTGRDWWTVIWVADNGKSYMTNPNNFRGLIDFVENLTVAQKDNISSVIAIAASSVGGPLAGSSASNVTQTISSALLNTQSTAGFKQHILREEDATEDNLIIIENDKVLFSSCSGISETGIKTLS